MVHVGVWERGAFIGAVLFSRGANRNLFAPYGLGVTEGAELTRVALAGHTAPVSRIVAVALKMLRKLAPGLRLVVSFADPAQGHVGGIYQAGGWIFCGVGSSSKVYVDAKGKTWHPRMISPSGVKKVFGSYRRVLTPAQCSVSIAPGKYRYLMPLDAAMHEQIVPLSKPYPKRVRPNGADENHSAAGGVAPTRTLHSSSGPDGSTPEDHTSQG